MKLSYPHLRKSGGEKIEKSIDEGSNLEKLKSQIPKDKDKPKTLPPYAKSPYPQLKKKNDQDVHFKKFNKMLTNMQVNLPFTNVVAQLLRFLSMLSS